MALSHNLVFLHGWGTDSTAWKHQIDYFSTRYPVEAPNNFLLPATYDLRPILIGWSYGGMRAIEIISEQPERFKALVLVGCSAKFSEGANPVVIKNIRRNLNRDFQATMRNCYGTFFSREEAVFIEEFVKGQALPDKKDTIDILDKLMVLDLKEKLKGIKSPTLIIHGAKDGVCPPEAAIYLNQNIKDSQLQILKEAGHMPFYTRSKEFNSILEEFIEGIK